MVKIEVVFSSDGEELMAMVRTGLTVKVGQDDSLLKARCATKPTLAARMKAQNRIVMSRHIFAFGILTCFRCNVEVFRGRD